MAISAKSQSALFNLPTELVLSIFEYAIIEAEPLLLNCGCDSSYTDEEEWDEDQARWESGEKHPPYQPGLTQTCRWVRSVTLPMFYERNAFRSHYCFRVDLDMSLRWLKAIGPDNRRRLKDFCFIDKNPLYDMQWERDLKRLQRREVFKEMDGNFETLESAYCCHRVRFGVEQDDSLEGLEALFEL
jgi:hypothetical protein